MMYLWPKARNGQSFLFSHRVKKELLEDDIRKTYIYFVQVIPIPIYKFKGLFCILFEKSNILSTDNPCVDRLDAVIFIERIGQHFGVILKIVEHPIKDLQIALMECLALLYELTEQGRILEILIELLPYIDISVGMNKGLLLHAVGV